jgi:putative DNA primase/helicase
MSEAAQTASEQTPAKKRAKAKPVEMNDAPAITAIQKADIVFPDKGKSNKFLATIENLKTLLMWHGIAVRYNVISKKIMFSIPGESFSVENGEDAAFACIYSMMKKVELPVDGYQPYLMRLADENQYNPVLEWIGLKPWDGTSRLQEFYDTIESPETEAKELLIRRWLITAVCMAKGEGVDSAGCLVLQGPQGLGKTWWVKKLVPDGLRNELVRTDANVNPADKDSVSQIISYWICELGEIGATFRKSDLDALKAFITRDHDTMRRPYGIGDKRYPRRTALIASVDQTIYLHDTAGNRRFWTIPCDAINSYHSIDMQQLWAEVNALVEAGETWQLEPDEKAHIARINLHHQQIEPIHEMLVKKYFDDEKFEIKEWLNATEIARAIELKNTSQRETRIITAYLRARGVHEKRTALGLLFHV